MNQKPNTSTSANHQLHELEDWPRDFDFRAAVAEQKEVINNHNACPRREAKSTNNLQ